MSNDKSLDDLAVFFICVILVICVCILQTIIYTALWNYSVVAALSIAKPIEFRHGFWVVAVFTLRAMFIYRSKSSSEKD